MTDTPRRDEWTPPADPFVDRPATRAAPIDTDDSYHRFQAEDRSLGEIASDALATASTLIKQEVELAKAEAKESASRAGKGVGLMAAGAVFALLALIALTLALTRAFAVVIGSYSAPAWGWGALVVTAIWAIVAVILVVVGRGALAKVRGLPETTETVSKIPNAVTGNEEKNR